MKRLVSNINRSITDALITKPFEEWIKKQTNELFGPLLKLPVPGAGTGQSVGIPGAAGQVANATGLTSPATAQFSTATTQFSAAVAQFVTAASATGINTAAGSVGSVAGNAIPALGFGTRPAGIAGPLLANGGFFSSAQGATASTATTQFDPKGTFLSGGSAVSGAELNAQGTAAIQEVKAVSTANLTTISSQTDGILSNLGNLGKGAIDSISSVLNSVGQIFSSGGSGIGSLFSSIFSTSSSGVSAAASAIGSWFAHEGGQVDANFPIRRLHIGGAISPAIDSVQLSKVAQSVSPRFHDGGGMMGGKIGGDATLKPGERMIIAEDGEYVIKKQTAMKIGLKKLEQLNRDQAMITAKMHTGGIVMQNSKYLQSFHQGGKILLSPQSSVLSPLNMPRFHDGGDISDLGSLFGDQHQH